MQGVPTAFDHCALLDLPSFGSDFGEDMEKLDRFLPSHFAYKNGNFLENGTITSWRDITYFSFFDLKKKWDEYMKNPQSFETSPPGNLASLANDILADFDFFVKVMYNSSHRDCLH